MLCLRALLLIKFSQAGVRHLSGKGECVGAKLDYICVLLAVDRFHPKVIICGIYLTVLPHLLVDRLLLLFD